MILESSAEVSKYFDDYGGEIVLGELDNMSDSPQWETSNIQSLSEEYPVNLFFALGQNLKESQSVVLVQ